MSWSKVRCDNAAVVHILWTGWCKNKLVMHLLRSSFLWLARTQVTLEAVHIPGRDNGPTDALLHNDLLSFESPSVVPLAVKELLIKPCIGWSSPIWTAL